MTTLVSNNVIVMVAARWYDLKLEKAQYFVCPICTAVRLATTTNSPLFLLEIARKQKKNGRAKDDTVT